jgi:preprotein translocase subunit SecE
MKLVASTGQFIHEVRIELSKVIWPGFDEFVGSTIVVLFLVVIFAIYLGALDTVFYWLAHHVLKLAIGR